MALSVRRVTEVRIDNDTRADEMRTVNMFARWHPDQLATGRTRDDRHPGLRALNTLIDRGPLTAIMVLRLADWVADIEAWAHNDLAAYQQIRADLVDAGVTVDQQPAPGSLGNPLVMSDVILAARSECLADCAEFRSLVLGPMLEAFGPDELDAAAIAEANKIEKQAAKADR